MLNGGSGICRSGSYDLSVKVMVQYFQSTEDDLRLVSDDGGKVLLWEVQRY